MATINLKNIPEDIRKYILKIQGEVKAKKGTQFSQTLTIFQIIREHQQLNEKK